MNAWLGDESDYPEELAELLAEDEGAEIDAADDNERAKLWPR